MSNLTIQFLQAAGRAGDVQPKITGTPQISYEGQSTFWKLCRVCMDQMPHIRKDDYSECAVCGCRTYAPLPTLTPGPSPDGRGGDDEG